MAEKASELQKESEKSPGEANDSGNKEREGGRGGQVEEEQSFGTQDLWYSILFLSNLVPCFSVGGKSVRNSIITHRLPMYCHLLPPIGLVCLPGGGETTSILNQKMRIYLLETAMTTVA